VCTQDLIYCKMSNNKFTFTFLFFSSVGLYKVLICAKTRTEVYHVIIAKRTVGSHTSGLMIMVVAWDYMDSVRAPVIMNVAIGHLHFYHKKLYLCFITSCLYVFLCTYVCIRIRKKVVCIRIKGAFSYDLINALTNFFVIAMNDSQIT